MEKNDLLLTLPYTHDNSVQTAFRTNNDRHPCPYLREWNSTKTVNKWCSVHWLKVCRYHSTNIDLESIEPMLATEANSRGVVQWWAYTHVPCDANIEQTLKTIRAGLINTFWFAVGEIGIDLYWDKPLRPNKRWPSWLNCRAKDLDLPVVIRHAWFYWSRHFSSLREQDGSLRGVFHCSSLRRKLKRSTPGFHLPRFRWRIDL